MEKALEFISSQAKLAKAPIYHRTHTRELGCHYKWHVHAIQHTSSVYSSICEHIRTWTWRPLDLELELEDEKYAMGLGKPDANFFQQLYPDTDPSLFHYTNSSQSSCIPNCLPNRWRLDLVRQSLQNATDDLRVVPLYWQLASSPEGNPGRGRGDCTHRNLYGTELMIFQWIRTILG